MQRRKWNVVGTCVTIIAVLAIVVTSAVGQAYAADKGGVYIAVKGGYEYKESSGGITDTAAPAVNQNATRRWSDQNGYALGCAIGYNFADMGLPVRAEAEYMYHSQFKFNSVNGTAATSTGLTSTKIGAQTMFANAYYDITTGTAFTPYVGAGLGVAWVNLKVSTNNASSTIDGDHDTLNFAWNVGAGVGYALSDNVVIDLGYRYTDFGDSKSVTDPQLPTVTQKFKDIHSHSALLALRYQF
jgi:opacity protein-like surface antigen